MGYTQERMQEYTPEHTERNQALVEFHPMVERIAQRAAATYGLPPGVDTDDLTSCGVLGLAEAWERYDASRGVAFEAYAIPRVRGAVIDAIRAGDWVPRKARQKARMTGEPVMCLVSMDERTSSDFGTCTADRLADEQTTQPGEDILASDERRELVWALNSLPQRERMIVSLHYFEGVALKSIAKTMGVTESRVSQLHTRALRMMRGELDTSEASTAA
jgi:RNA polymerase sigma factor FliA